jgi:hypothetical protein
MARPARTLTEPRPRLAVELATIHAGDMIMKAVLAAFALAALALGSTTAAEAKGCLKGAVVGGVAGHYAGHHGALGAAAGCLYGRHAANKQERQQHGQPQNAQGKM